MFKNSEIHNVATMPFPPAMCLIFFSMQIDRYCNTEGTAFLIRQHIPGASLLKETEEQLVYALPYKDTDRFSGTAFLFFSTENWKLKSEATNGGAGHISKHHTRC